MFLFSNVGADVARATEGRLRFQNLGAKIEGLRTALPARLSWYLHKRGYDLHEGALGMIGLSNALGRDDYSAGHLKDGLIWELCLCTATTQFVHFEVFT
jgi:hypothetical protein